MGYLRRISNYYKNIVFFYLTRMMSMSDPIAIDVETSKIDNECFLRKSSFN